MPKSKIKTFSLQPKIIKLLCNCFNTENISEAVYKGLIGFLSNTFYGEHMDDFALHQLLTVEERTTIKKYSVRITKELEQMQEQFREEKEQFREEMKALNRRMAAERQRLKDDNLFFEKKMEILKGGFTELDMDRRRLEKEWARLEAQKEVMQQPVYSSGRDVSDLFQGVKNPLALKKRYKDLIKIFHPDNVAGDKEMIQKINIEYENLKHDFDIGRWA